MFCTILLSSFLNGNNLRPKKGIIFQTEGSTLLGTLFTRLISNTTSKKMKFSIMDSVCRIYLRKEKENV